MKKNVLDALFEKCLRDRRAEDARRAGIYPYFHRLESRQDVEVVMDGRRRIMLGSNYYLGLTTCLEVVEAGIKALEKYGTGCRVRAFSTARLTFISNSWRNLRIFSARRRR